MPRVALVRGNAEVASWAIPAGQNPDLSVVDHLARLQLAARRAGCSLRLRGASSLLRELLDLVGLSDIVTGAAGPASPDPAGPASPDPAGPASPDPAGPASPDRDGLVGEPGAGGTAVGGTG